MVLVVVEVLDNSVSRVAVVVQIHSPCRVGVVVFGRRMVVVGGNVLFSLLHHHHFFGGDEFEGGSREGIPWLFPVILINVGKERVEEEK
ncbi:hypothetical protein NC652_031072 [Populus alba x Populus x berolinensis]|nr:hypothetical protein NC652_031072 [Populus alba x Populus x berolinensis]